MSKKSESHRQLKVASLIQSAVSEVLLIGKNIDLKLLDNPVTITRVKVSGDLKIATCYFLPFKRESSKDEIMTHLDKAKYNVRSYITEKLNLKFSPEIRFFYDDAYDNAHKVEEILKKLDL